MEKAYVDKLDGIIAWHPEKQIKAKIFNWTLDEEFKEPRAELDKTINALKAQSNETESDKDKNLMELTEKADGFPAFRSILRG